MISSVCRKRNLGRLNGSGAGAILSESSSRDKFSLIFPGVVLALLSSIQAAGLAIKRAQKCVTFIQGPAVSSANHVLFCVRTASPLPDSYSSGD